jgi:hypothetical protein
MLSPKTPTINLIRVTPSTAGHLAVPTLPVNPSQMMHGLALPLTQAATVRSIIADSSVSNPDKEMEEAEPFGVQALAIIGAPVPVVGASLLSHPEAAPMAFGTMPIRYLCQYQFLCTIYESYEKKSKHPFDNPDLTFRAKTQDKSDNGGVCA